MDNVNDYGGQTNFTAGCEKSQDDSHMSDGGYYGASGDATFDNTLASEHSIIGRFVIPRKRIRLNF